MKCLRYFNCNKRLFVKCDKQPFLLINKECDLFVTCVKREKLLNTLLSVFKSFLFVRMKGLEPPRRETLDPKSSAATNYATSASAFVS